MRGSNPTLSDKALEQSRQLAGFSGEAMTVNGSINKCITLIGICIAVAVYAWKQTLVQIPNSAEVALQLSPYVMVSAIVGLVLALIICFKKTLAPVLAPVYAAVEGFLIGSVSANFEYMYNGIVSQAITGTVVTFVVLLALYRSGIIKATQRFKSVLFTATAAIMVLYVLSFVLSFFSINVPYIHESGMIGIGFSVFVVVIAALNLIIDFDFIEKGSAMKAPKYMEWYAGFGLLVTLIWLYLEILRLLAKTKRR